MNDPSVVLNSAVNETRFEFGANWRRFLETVDDARIEAAVESLRATLRVDSLAGQTFLDVGSGSGLFSLAAHQLGATVHSFDYDSQSVACTQEIKRRYGSDSPPWQIEQGSALDSAYLQQLQPADVVYSWGVLHHTGDMWTAIDLVAQLVKPGGCLWIAIYNDQGQTSTNWTQIKRLYHKLPTWLRPVLCLFVAGVLLFKRLWGSLIAFLFRLFSFSNPLAPVKNLARAVATRQDARGMHRWYDLVDWVGGYPFEVARPEAVFDFLQLRGFSLERLKTCGGGLGCNEFVFRRATSPSASHADTE